MDVLQRLEELERRVAQMVVRGKIHKVDPAKHVAQVEYGPGLTTGWLQWKPIRTGKAIVWWCPEVGEGVTVISEGDLSLGEILPGSYHKDFAAPSSDPDLFLIEYGDGGSTSYNRKSHLYRLDVAPGGRAEITATGGVVMVAPDGGVDIDATAGGVRIKGDTEIVGALRVTKNIKSDAEVLDKVRAMSADRALYNQHAHTPQGPAPQQ
jgi:phage baseplate assembly protein V